MVKSSVLLFAALYNMNIFAGAACTAPLPDNFYEARLPEMKGKVLEIDVVGPDAFIKIDNHKAKVQVELSKIKIFTQFGGNVFFKELKVGDDVQIWVRNCNYEIEAKIVRSDEILVVRKETVR